MFESLYDLTESSNVNFIGCVSERNRYDFAIVYTSYFFGKPLVVCMQTGRSVPMCTEDLKDTELIRTRFRIEDSDMVEELAALLRARLPTLAVQDQY